MSVISINFHKLILINLRKQKYNHQLDLRSNVNSTPEAPHVTLSSQCLLHFPKRNNFLSSHTIAASLQTLWMELELAGCVWLLLLIFILKRLCFFLCSSEQFAFSNCLKLILFAATVSDFWKHWEDGTESFNILHIQFALLSISYICMLHLLQWNK